MQGEISANKGWAIRGNCGTPRSKFLKGTGSYLYRGIGAQPATVRSGLEGGGGVRTVIAGLKVLWTSHIG